MSNFQSYVICTCPRSGSTLLWKLLAATGRTGRPESYFHNPSISEWMTDNNLSPADYSNDRAALGAIVRSVRQRGDGGTGIFGLRLQRQSFDFLMAQLDALYPGLPNDVARFRAAFGETLFVYLTRRNKLEQAVSVVKAMQTGLWHQAPDGREIERLSPPRAPFYDGDEIAREFAELTAYDKDWLDWFAREKIAPLCLDYDELSADPIGTLGQVLTALGLDARFAEGVRPATEKLADATNQAWAERFAAERDGDVSG